MGIINKFLKQYNEEEYDVQDVRPLTHELRHVYIAGDGKVFLDKAKAEAHQKQIEGGK
ncbi:MAG: hypothetical protein Unbinned4311contig1001_45 [Prokaryotic dsDNA virus sp.]|nr:MAG: hypothetical protein Unbinned4311contig1001_45 [Prokaryotic dsDNA virus sp.]|tara:strand:+ start:750 stop:923 length:174 start_codon:yes stop_codon:yes gene_type:complete